MRNFHTLVHSLLLVTSPSLLAYPQCEQTIQCVSETPWDGFNLSYDEILHLLQDIEAGRITPTEAQLERMTHFIAFLAQQGILPGDYAAHAALQTDIAALFDGVASFSEDNAMFCRHSKKGNKDRQHDKHHHHHHHHHSLFDKVKDFVKKHKKAIIIGAAVIVGATVVIAIVAAVSSASAVAAGVATAVAAAGAAAASKDTATTPEVKNAVETQIASFKETLITEEHLNSDLPIEETMRTLGSLFAHQSAQQFINLPPLFQDETSGHTEIDQKFSTDYGYHYMTAKQEADFNALAYQARGEKALSLGYFNQAALDLGKAIETDPTNPLSYLKRGMAHFNLGQYERSLEDYKQFASQTQLTYPFSVAEFSYGFARGLPKGVYDSGEGFFLFMTDFVTHPIRTSVQVVDSISTLVGLIGTDEWGIIGEALCPEVLQLVNQWNSLHSDKRGELAGYAVGKHGADILAPGAIAKVASKCTKSAQKLVAVCKNLRIAQETLVLETASGIGNSVKIAEVVRNGQTMTFLGEELGFTAQEMGQLKKVGKLEQAIDSTCENWLSKSPSEAYLAAKNGGKHARIITEFSGKPVKEIQKSIRSYEKLITEHKDKIANPSKYCPDWDAFHPNRQKALVEKIWPTEIQCYTEQMDILQTILNQQK